jgi:hypothetical protein
MSISTVTSEALQLKLRQLLPSQQGFGTDLTASDTIIPIIDLTASAEGSDVGSRLQEAINHSDAITFSISAAQTTIANTSGFYRCVGSATVYASAGSQADAQFNINDGSTNKVVWSTSIPISSAAPAVTNSFDIVFWLNVGDTLSGIATGTGVIIGSARQIADTNGTLIQPTGFTPQ